MTIESASRPSDQVVSRSVALSAFPAETDVSAAAVAASWRPERVLVVLDDDPTGTQSVSQLPVLTRWEEADFRWAFALESRAVYVLTNTRSLGPLEAAARNREVVANALAARGEREIAFVSRSDSTLRGHFPLEPSVIADELEKAGSHTDGIVVVPAFPDAGRVTINGVHYVSSGSDELTPVAQTEFASDATFGFSRSDLPGYIEEKSLGQIPADSVIVLDLGLMRSGAEAIASQLENASERALIVADAVVESDLRALSLGLALAEERGKRFLYRVGPPFVRARIGQAERAPLSSSELYGGNEAPASHGLVVVGSHVAQTTSQLERLLQDGHASVVQIDVGALLDPERRSDEIAAAISSATSALREHEVVVHTSRVLVRTESGQDSLAIARSVSAAIVAIVQGIMKAGRPRYVIAKGGITSSDVAAHGLEIARAIVLGPLLPGIISAWRPVGGPADGIPFVVFAGNVGDDDALASVIKVLSADEGARA
ncbi:four-carbon acid sugar kinase family protein [Mycetocola zhujimingii]|uniref:four-carbon acid sugar kinase family protein n=1 Tax=Mycetocola zhujimingii TaxID=2079792 RepID=UPI000D398FCC|nr:four-carbon acid sugar kinase family protein [Mycetocola zhujimingii]AWB87661.1 hypothetical protein C3E77_14315 [Mycetocola zhujimingii]